MVIGITGATGFLGAALAREAKKRGHRTVGYTRGGASRLPHVDEVRPLHASSEGADPILDPSGLDALVHLAGESVMGLWTPAKKRRIRDSRVEVTRRVVEALQACTAGRPAVFLCASGTGAYGDRGDEVLTESSTRGTSFLAQVCEAWEHEAQRAGTLGMRTVSLRTGVVLGQGGGTWPLLRRVFKLRLGSRLGSGRQWVPWIHLDDEIGIILHAIENSACQGPVNLAAPHPVTNAELTRAIARALHTSTFIPVPAFALKLAGGMGSVVLESARVQPALAKETGYQFQHPRIDEALAALEQSA